MKIFCVSLGRNGTQSLTQFLRDQGISTTHFYRFKDLEPGTFSEDADGIYEHFLSLPDTDAHVDIPTCLVFDRVFEKYPDARYINITRPEQEWVASMQKISSLLAHDHDPYIFEEAYCNFYANTGKTKIQDLTAEELKLIRNTHLNRIDSFFKDKDNYLEVELSDPDIGNKIRKFINSDIEIEFPLIDRIYNLTI